MSELQVPESAQVAVTTKVDEFPFRTELSLAPLIRYWEHEVAEGCSVLASVARTVLDQVARAPELAGPVTDLTAVRVHDDLLRALMVAVFSPAAEDDGYAAALLPFRLRTFFATPGFARLLTGGDGFVLGRVDVDADVLVNVRMLHAYSLILLRVYGIDVGVEYPWVSSVKDPDTGLDRYFKFLVNRRFLDVDVVGEPPALTEALRQRLGAGILDPAALLAVLPPDKFVIRGFSIIKAVEVTEQEVLSAIERELIDKESIVSTERFRGLQDKVRALLRRPEIDLGLAAIEGDRILTLNFGSRDARGCIFAGSTHHRVSDFAGSVYERAAQERRPLFVEDLEAWPKRSRAEEWLLAEGYRSLVVAPLIYQDAIIGSLKLASAKPGSLNLTLMPHLQQILPLFAMAVKRSMDELNNRVQAIIKEHCTAIHPVVEWRFRKAVLGGLERPAATTGEGQAGQIEPIVFRDVYPLYALSDIRGSSSHRAWAIQSDLLTQLGLAREILHDAYRVRPMPILDQIRHKIERYASDVEVSMRSGDEVGLIALDPQLGAVGTRRRAFEESLTLINDTIATYLDAEEQAAQILAPHYFEKQRTDGVDYSIYAGASLLEDGGFTPLHLKNLRLWQLMVACGIAREVERVKPRLAEPLETTSLILVQHAPLSIRFRFDEKRFDVDGAYNVRYEIMKKRIDKAVVRGTTERVTQPGKIAIVYSQEAEAAEYRDYIAYLQSLGSLERDVEPLDLEELQGVSGLRALRVTVSLEPPADETRGALATAARRALG